MEPVFAIRSVRSLRRERRRSPLRCDRPLRLCTHQAVSSRRLSGRVPIRSNFEGAIDAESPFRNNPHGAGQRRSACGRKAI